MYCIIGSVWQVLNDGKNNAESIPQCFWLVILNKQESVIGAIMKTIDYCLHES